MSFRQWRFSRIIAGVLLPIYLTGCMTWKTQEVSPQQVIAERQPGKMRVTLTNGRQFVLSHPGVSGDTLSGRAAGDSVSIALADVARTEVPKISAVWTAVGLTLGLVAVAGVALAVWAATFEVY